MSRFQGKVSLILYVVIILIALIGFVIFLDSLTNITGSNNSSANASNPSCSLSTCPSTGGENSSLCNNTHNRNEGQICQCSGQCAANLLCDNTSHCCPSGQEWDTNLSQCSDTYSFYMVFIQLNGQISNFDQRAEQGKDAWVTISPLNQCPQRVKAIAITNRVCPGPDYTNYCRGDESVADAGFQALTNCEDTWPELEPYRNLATRVIGVVPGSYLCSSRRGGEIRGYTSGAGGRYLVSSEDSITLTTTHEMAHTFGLCDEGYGGGPCTSCNSTYCNVGGTSCTRNLGDCCPDKPEQNSIMCTEDICNTGCTYGPGFAPSSYNYLEAVLNKYCQ
jgi:hypothetical protein